VDINLECALSWLTARKSAISIEVIDIDFDHELFIFTIAKSCCWLPRMYGVNWLPSS
jgi:hypothetical protein